MALDGLDEIGWQIRQPDTFSDWLWTNEEKVLVLNFFSVKAKACFLCSVHNSCFNHLRRIDKFTVLLHYIAAIYSTQNVVAGLAGLADIMDIYFSAASVHGNQSTVAYICPCLYFGRNGSGVSFTFDYISLSGLHCGYHRRYIYSHKQPSLRDWKKDALICAHICVWMYFCLLLLQP